jgi:hypothetical protein
MVSHCGQIPFPTSEQKRAGIASCTECNGCEYEWGGLEDLHSGQADSKGRTFLYDPPKASSEPSLGARTQCPLGGAQRATLHGRNTVDDVLVDKITSKDLMFDNINLVVFCQPLAHLQGKRMQRCNNVRVK